MLIDVHCHANLYLNLDRIVNEAENEGVSKIIAVSMSAKSLERVIDVSKKYSQIYPALGIHPEEVRMNKEIADQLDSVRCYINNHKEEICAIGEIGLDHHFVKEEDLYPLQRTIFEKMLDLAQKLNLPVNLHTKGAEKEIFDLLPSYDLPNANIHWYSGPEQFLKQGIDRGYYFSITPAISYSTAVRNVVSMVNEERLLLESDGPVKYSGAAGTPSMVRNVLDSVSKIKGIDPSLLEEKILNNKKQIFPKIFN
jgi:TatD DNase family protein